MESKPKFPDKDSVITLLKNEKLEFKCVDHPSLNTVQEGLDYFEKNKPEVKDMCFCKNLFLKNKAGGLILLTCHYKTNADFKVLCKILKTKNGNIRQAEEDKMELFLHVKPGSVTPFGMMNVSEEQKKDIKFYLDKAIDTEYIGIHPMLNDSTVFMKKSDMISVLTKNGVEVNEIDFNVSTIQEDKEAKTEEKEKKKPKEEKKKKDAQSKEAKEGDEELAPQGIMTKKEEDFSEWFQECIVKSEMVEYYEISGCYILRPWSYQIWEFIQAYLDKLIKAAGVENAYFPMFVSERALFKEKEHVEGFSPEVAWVTRSGKSEINPPIAIRPTSETIMYPAFAKWIRSHRDLPLQLNQWTNIVRWEFKNPTPFIRTREFLWQEGHTAHATCAEADEMVLKALEMYRLTYEDLCAIPVIPGKKSENEKFAGGVYTASIETIIPANGKGVQCATSHALGQNFSKMCDITFFDKEKQKQHVWQTSWGLTTRTIGVLIMMHSDNSGLVLPPKVAPLQVIIIPIKTSKDDHQAIQAKGESIYKELKDAGVRVKLDDSDLHNPGWKYAQWELKGVPIRIEYGAKDLAKDQVTVFLRYNKTKTPVKLNEVKTRIIELLDEIHHKMFDKIKTELEAKKTNADNFNAFLEGLNKGNMVLTPWCTEPKCEDEVKLKVKQIAIEKKEEESVGTCKTLCIPYKQNALKPNAKCFFCQREAKVEAIWGRSY